ncbi:Crp/Fnr family transcriptional regulator [Flavobacterium cerinum]|uniref:Crp/Fnr family transcriptional regulator n=1 Tax=Flavobacterium cerinum TaxID=2502784 RepID=A0A3S3SF34_9FLAO|nr:Crp/Fnr family transcriptional regulator [Flavobacterium cerinum]RWX00784.1 Crp/Fnr family transcriptional regulator [Flavobacterium cerinum]
MGVHLNKINEFIDSLDEEVTEALTVVSDVKTFKKGDYLLRDGETCKKSYFIQEGTARKFYINDGKEITTEIYFPDDLAISFSSYVGQHPGREFIQALTDIKVSVTDYIVFAALKTKYSVLTELDLLLTEHYALWLEERLFELHTLNATQRYELLLSRDPQIIKNIPLTYIASYLSISLETLSRIRAKR